MEWVILFAIACAYSGISSKIDKLGRRNFISCKSFPSLKTLIGKRIVIETDDNLNLIYDWNIEGVLKDYNDKWIVMECINKNNKTELYYYRLSNIVSIDLID